MSGSPRPERHPVTGLPTGRYADERARTALDAEDGCVMYVGLDHLAAFEGGQGLFGPDAVLRFLAILLVDSLDEIGEPGDMVAHLGRDEFVIVTARECADRLRDRIRRRFAEEVIGFYDPVDWSRGYSEYQRPEGGTWRVPLLSLNFTVHP
jgi:GGDEF domain-containing protein